MTTVCLVACTSKKALYPTIAEDLYRSPLFEGAKWFAQARCDAWYILSAKYGLLHPSKKVKPYDESLHQMDEAARIEWSNKVRAQLKKEIGSSTRIIFLAGDKYRKHLQTFLNDDGHQTASPLSELGIGRQVAWLQKLSKEKSRLNDLDRFYQLLERAAKVPGKGWNNLANHVGKAVPKKGIYFFIQSGELRMTQPFEHRIVRVGTHAVSAGSKAELWNRLRTHRGAEDGRGNHRGSIFRLHVGQSLLQKAGRTLEFPTWGVGQSATKDIRALEIEIELEASKVIAAMPVLWLEISDEASPDSDRAYLERNLIALLSGPTGPLDLPGTHWLGRQSNRDAISFSGLWNVNYVYDDYDPYALDVLEEYVIYAEGKSPMPNSLAPKGWRTRILESRLMKQQMELM